ncbi:N-6 DNA methylase [Streptomyces sp. KN37]|uniref:N-6 DNA methylase n=1 Tax=Streptomyces sp. KN37 TaxID=3090667 RepID=UPI002A74DAF0|nr:N-6 DNA methylase [Streptomyces sp. KN37]WPO76311.1 N-6 DNA methylase [Streptomyces sp. KN37]
MADVTVSVPGVLVVRDLVLFTNSKHAKGKPAGELAWGTLGAWLAGRGDGTKFTTFPPDRIAAVIGTAHGQVISAYDVVEGDDGKTWVEERDAAERMRVRFHGVPSEEFGPLVGQPSPRTWRRGERNPVKVMELEELRALYADVQLATPGNGARLRAAIGGASVTVDADGDLTVEAPPGVAVTVRTTPYPSPNAQPGRDAESTVSNRPETGKYYTPETLTRAVVESALGTLTEQIIKGEPVQIYDPTTGSGAMLTAAFQFTRTHEATSAFIDEAIAYADRLRAACGRESKSIMELVGEETLREAAAVIERRLSEVTQ